MSADNLEEAAWSGGQRAEPGGPLLIPCSGLTVPLYLALL